MPVDIAPKRKAHEARRLLRRYLPITRLVRARSLSWVPDHTVYLKLETELPTGTFKVRGALYALSERLRQGPVEEVVCSSTGNHGAAVAYAGHAFKVPVTVFLPTNPNPVKKANISSLGAKVIEYGLDSADAAKGARSYAAKEGRYLLDDATDPWIPIGTATIGYEILEQMPGTDTIYVPIGDTALIRGIAGAMKQISARVGIVGVQAQGAPAYYLSWKNRRPVGTGACDTIAEGLVSREPVAANVHAIVKLVPDIQLVSDEQLLDAVRLLLLEEHIVSEPAGAAGLAAFLQSIGDAGHNIVLVITGSNVSKEILQRAICSRPV